MSITHTLNNALSGLSAVARAADVVSANVSNALTEGYGRRELLLSARSLGGVGAGVAVDGVARHVDQVVLADRRLADSEVVNAEVRNGFLSRVETLLGDPTKAGSLSARLAGFEQSLIAAASRPDSESRLTTVLNSAKDIVRALNALGQEIQNARIQADGQIATEIGRLNGLLSELRDLNVKITSARATGQDATGLLDQRQRLVDRVAEIVPVREVARQGDKIGLYTTGGAILLEGSAAVLGFSAVGVIAPDMTLGGGALSGLTLNGFNISPTDTGVLGGGRLGALFAMRDELAVSAQGQMDAFARDLIARFASPAVDPSLAVGAAGLFTDNGAAFDPLDEVGIAGRISINALADPAQGGALWRLRDGLGAPAPGPVGDATLLQSLGAAFAAPVIPASGAFMGAARSAHGLAADILSQISGARQQSETVQSYAAARQESLKELELRNGVDTDQEMQTLLMIEQAYAANARVIQTVDMLIKQLMEL